MLDRPMKQISLRKFRDSITDLREVVEVSRRDGEGNIDVLGFWTPYRLPVIEPAAESPAPPAPPAPPPLEIPIPETGEPVVIRTPEEAAAVVATTPRAYPKDVQARGRRRRR